MNTIDEILATGRYTDRRGREWHHSAFLPRWISSSGFNYFGQVYAFVYEDEMRLLIERDQHRGECVGLHDCYVHPTPRILFHHGLWSVVAPGLQAWKDSRHIEFADAWDAARALAVES